MGVEDYKRMIICPVHISYSHTLSSQCFSQAVFSLYIKANSSARELSNKSVISDGNIVAVYQIVLQLTGRKSLPVCLCRVQRSAPLFYCVSEAASPPTTLH